MPIDRDVLEAVREMDEHGLRRLLMLARARLERRGVPTGDATDAKVTLRQQEVRCGKATCTTCPHGPYWYAYWSEEGRRRSRYLGKLDDVPEALDTDATGVDHGAVADAETSDDAATPEVARVAGRDDATHAPGVAGDDGDLIHLPPTGV